MDIVPHKRQKEPSIALIFYKLPFSYALSRQSRVRAPSSPPDIPKYLWDVWDQRDNKVCSTNAAQYASYPVFLSPF